MTHFFFFFNFLVNYLFTYRYLMFLTNNNQGTFWWQKKWSSDNVTDNYQKLGQFSEGQ